MEWFEAIILGLVQGLTEFLPVSSSGHLVIGREILGVEESGDLVFEVAVHAATVLSTIVVFRHQIWSLLKGLFRFKYNDETDYILKICVSMIPVFIIGVFFMASNPRRQLQNQVNTYRNGISYWQALAVGIGQAFAVVPGLSRSGTTISVGLICGVRRDVMAQFSFLMVLVPILGEAFLQVVGGEMTGSSIGVLPVVLGFVSAFLSGLFACKVMIALVKKAKLTWFALYCAIVALCIFLFS